MKTNPRLKRYILEIVDNQLRDNDPPVTRETLNRLISKGYDVKTAKEKIASVLVEDIFNAMQGLKQFDEKDYARRLARLN